jgi:hypothetical protein
MTTPHEEHPTKSSLVPRSVLRGDPALRFAPILREDLT